MVSCFNINASFILRETTFSVDSVVIDVLLRSDSYADEKSLLDVIDSFRNFRSI